MPGEKEAGSHVFAVKPIQTITNSLPSGLALPFLSSPGGKSRAPQVLVVDHGGEGVFASKVDKACCTPGRRCGARQISV